MRITLHTDYALRVLIYLDLNRERLVTIGEIAGAYDISANHLMKIVHLLKRLGYVETVRGKSGGTRLARPADSIGIGEVFRRLEDSAPLVECFGDRHACRITPVCRLKYVRGDARNAFLDVLDRCTLGDLTAEPARAGLVRRLRLDA